MEKIVWFLALPLLNLGHRLYVDNFYTSVQLFKALSAQNTVVCGTIQTNRKWYPQKLVQKKLDIGESFALRSGELLAFKFRDRKDVHMLSTMQSSSCTTVNVRRKSIQSMDKPDCILSYNRMMGAVDKSDQLIEPYDATRISMVWYKKLAIHLLQLAMLNAHIAYKKSHPDPKMSLLEFTNEVITELVHGDHNAERSDLDTTPHENVLRLTGRHFPMKIPVSSDQKKVMKCCKVCYKKKVRRESRYT